jgi:hypothetical protein
VGAGRLTIELQSLTQKQNQVVLYFPLRNQCCNGNKRKLKRKKNLPWLKARVMESSITDIQEKGEPMDSNGSTKS